MCSSCLDIVVMNNTQEEYIHDMYSIPLDRDTEIERVTNHTIHDEKSSRG